MVPSLQGLRGAGAGMVRQAPYVAQSDDRQRERTAARVSIPLRKRAFDLAIAGPVVVLLAPLFLLTALLVKLTSRGPVLFRQERIGLGDTPFVMLKFRSMVTGSDD